jgi:hypothetical protein
MDLTWKETRFLPVPLAAPEVGARGEQLADLITERDELEVSHKKEKGRMKSAMDTIDARIRHLAKIVNERVEERSVTVEVRYNSNLNMVEEVRTDSGEIIKTRTPTEEDKVRAASEQQAKLPGTDPEAK